MMNTLLLRYGLGKFDFSGAILSSLADGICAVDTRGRVTFMNAAAERMLIWTEVELLGKNIHKTLHRCKKDDGIPVPAARCSMLATIRSQAPVRCDDDRLRRKDGQMIAVTYTSSPLRVNEQIVGIIFAFRDMTERERELESLRQSEDQYRSVVEASPDSMWLSDLYGFVIMANKRAAEMFGYAAPAEMLHMGTLQLIATEDRPRAVQDKRKALGTGVCNDAQYTLLRQDGASFSANVTTTLILGPDEQPKALMSVAHDVSPLSVISPEAPVSNLSGTMEEAMIAVNIQIGSFLERKEAEKAMEYQALHDALTDLPNRVLFQERLQRALGLAHGSRTTLAVFLIDLDRFKQVNDTLGQEQGDQLLKQVGNRLQAVLRGSDTVARLNGDEFAVLLPGTPQAGATVVAQKLLESLRQPVAIGNQTVQLGASVGVAAFPEHGGNSQTLLHCADVAMYAAKRAKSGFAVYTLQYEQDDPRDQSELQA